MYNLLVSSDSEAWNGDPYFFDADRISEYTDEVIREKYGDLSQSQINEIIRFPCIFAYESRCRKDPKFGFIREIIKRQGQGKVKISYEIINLSKFLTYSDLLEMQFELDISNWELNRTHWAIKDVDLQKELIAKGIKLPDRNSKDELMHSNQHYDYDVALSFAGEDREYAEALAEALKRHGMKVFYDRYEKSTLWGKNLYTHLSDLYQNQARYCVIFVSRYYATKVWTTREREAAQARALQEQEEYILPIRLDNTEIPGILSTTAYLSWPPETAESIADAILEKLGKINRSDFDPTNPDTTRPITPTT